MRRTMMMGAALLVLIGLFIFMLSDVEAAGVKPVKILSPRNGDTFTVWQQPEILIQWTRTRNVLWYDVRIYGAPDENGKERYVNYRYNPDTDNDWRRDDPHLYAQAAILDQYGVPNRIIITPYDGTDAFWEEYGDWFPLPTGLSMDHYEAMAPGSKPVTIYVWP